MLSHIYSYSFWSFSWVHYAGEENRKRVDGSHWTQITSSIWNRISTRSSRSRCPNLRKCPSLLLAKNVWCRFDSWQKKNDESISLLSEVKSYPPAHGTSRSSWMWSVRMSVCPLLQANKFNFQPRCLGSKYRNMLRKPLDVTSTTFHFKNPFWILSWVSTLLFLLEFIYLAFVFLSIPGIIVAPSLQKYLRIRMT